MNSESKARQITPRLRISIITPSTNIHGGTKRLLTIAKHLQKRGHQITVIRQFESRPLDWLNVDYPIVDIRFNENSQLSTIEAQFPNGDILITYGNCKANSLLEKLSLKKGRKYILFMHFGIHDESLDRQNAKLNGFIPLCTTNWIAEGVKRASGKKARVIGFGVHNDQFFPEPNSNTKFTVGTLMHDSDWKRSNDVVVAIELVRREYPVRLLMFGQTQKSKFPSFVEYHHDPSQEHLRKLYNKCHLWVMPSLFEGIGMCSVEAMLCKTPLLTTDTGGGRDFCTMQNSTFIPKKSPNHIVSQIEDAIRNPDIYISKAEQAFIDISRHTWDTCIDTLEEILFEDLRQSNPLCSRDHVFHSTCGFILNKELDTLAIERLQKQHPQIQFIVFVQFPMDQLNPDVFNRQLQFFPFDLNWEGVLAFHSMGRQVIWLGVSIDPFQELNNILKENLYLNNKVQVLNDAYWEEYDAIPLKYEQVWTAPTHLLIQIALDDVLFDSWTDKRILFIYNAAHSSATRKRVFEWHKYLHSVIQVESIHWSELSYQRIRDADVVIMHRIGGFNEKISKSFVSKIARFIRQHPDKHFIYDLDDLIVRGQDNLPIRMMRLSDGVISTTSTLEERLREWNANSVVIPNGFDAERYYQVTEHSVKQNTNQLKIVCFSFAGAGLDIMEELGQLLHESATSYAIHLYCNKKIIDKEPIYVKLHEVVDLDEMFEILFHSDYLINWGPHSTSYLDSLTDQYALTSSDFDGFVDAKSGLKCYHAALSRTVILSSSTPSAYAEIIDHGENGYLINDAAEAFQIIKYLEDNPKVKDSNLRKMLSKIHQEFTMSALLPSYLLGLQKSLKKKHSYAI